MILDWTAVLENCLRRIGRWQRLPHWSRNEWMKEMRAEGFAAAWQATCEYDFSLGVPFCAFVYRRVIGCALSRYRREWAYFAHYCSAKEDGQDSLQDITDRLSCSDRVQESLYCALELL